MIPLLLAVALRGVPPLSPLRVLHAYSSVGRYAAGDRGVDLAGSPGQQVVSAIAGTVTFAGPVAGRGVVSVTLPDGRRVTYEPLVIGVAHGARVAAGTAIGRLSPGWPGCAAAACLHWGLVSGEGSTLAYADPMTLLRPLRVRLLPLAPAGASDAEAVREGAPAGSRADGGAEADSDPTAAVQAGASLALIGAAAGGGLAGRRLRTRRRARGRAGPVIGP